jgi:hypothetical protein
MDKNKLSKKIDVRARRILEICQNKKVIHFGCADVPFTEERIQSNNILHGMILSIASECIGVDVSDHGISLLQNAYPGTQYFTPKDTDLWTKYDPDIIIVGEVLEHIREFSPFFTMIKKLSSQKTRIIFTTPNAYSLKGCLRAIAGKEMQHPDHICLFSGKTISRLLGDYGITIKNISYYNNPPRNFISMPFGYFVNSILKFFPNASDGLFVEAGTL